MFGYISRRLINFAANINDGKLQAKTAPKNPAPEMSRLSTYRSVCSKNTPAKVSAIHEPASPAIADITTRENDCLRVSAVPNHPTRDAAALHVATNATREKLIHSSELSAAGEQHRDYESAEKRRRSPRTSTPAIERTVICRTASLMIRQATAARQSRNNLHCRLFRAAISPTHRYFNTMNSGLLETLA